VVVETASARAVDLGCAYTLSVDAAGTGRLEVTSGWVALESSAGAVYVPRGAEAALRAGAGPGTPVFTDASPQTRELVARIDASLAKQALDEEALAELLGAARLRDTLSLYNLLMRVAEPERARVLDRMLALGAPVPHDLSRAALLAADAATL